MGIKGIIIGAAGAAALLHHEEEHTPAPPTEPLPPGYSLAERTAAALRDRTPAGGWRWPLSRWRGLVPAISDGVGSMRDGGTREHHGVDIDYQVALDAFPEFRAGGVDRQRSTGGRFICPDGATIVAAADGLLWSVGDSPKGIQVVIDHGMPWCTYYQHLATCKFSPRKAGKGGPAIKAGDIIGTVGNDRSKPTAFNHLHFEIWYRGGASAFIDPAAILKTATVG